MNIRAILTTFETLGDRFFSLWYITASQTSSFSKFEFWMLFIPITVFLKMMYFTINELLYLYYSFQWKEQFSILYKLYKL